MKRSVKLRFVIYPSSNACWYWELRDANGTAVARSATGFDRQQDAMENARTVRTGIPRACLYNALGGLLIERDFQGGNG